MQKFKNYINGTFVESQSGKSFKTIDPSTEKEFAEICAAEEFEVNFAVESAHNAFIGEWSKILPYQRAKYLRSIGDQLKDKAELLGTIETKDTGKLFKETRLFCDWYAKKYISIKKLPKFNIEINNQIKFLLSNLKLKNDTFVHRDFHASNLMIYKKKLATIDTQDALIGNIAYDLASLIDDVRFKTNKKLKNSIYNYYFKLNKKKINKTFLSNDFEILSVIRNMKIIGIFARLATRDKKKKYLKLIPYAWKLIELRIKDNKIFDSLEKILDLNFSKKIRNLK